MKYNFTPQGVCCAAMQIEIDNDVVASVRFSGGCQGNLQAVAKLVEGMSTSDVIDRLSGIRCGYKTTSCPDQLASALKEITSK